MNKHFPEYRWVGPWHLEYDRVRNMGVWMRMATSDKLGLQIFLGQSFHLDNENEEE